MQNIDYQVRHEHYKDLAREAKNERLAREVAGRQNSRIKNVRHALGRHLVQAGHHLLDEH